MARLRTTMVRVAAVGIAVSLAACSAGSNPQGTDETSSGSESQAGAQPEDSSLTVGFSVEPANLDFTQTAGAAIPQALADNVYEGLVTLNEAGEIVPHLAESWGVSDDRKTYSFTLREGVTFSNGDSFDAEIVKFSLERVRDEWNVPQASGMDVLDEVRVVSPTEVEVVLSQPSNNWLYRMTTRIGVMFTPNGVSDLANVPVGTGPFEVTRFTRGDSIEMHQRDDYWGEAPFMDAVTFRYFKDSNAMTNAMLTGDIDVIGSVTNPESLNQFQDEGKYQVIQGATNGETVLSMNNAEGPLADIRVRQAVKHAIDHQAIIDTVTSGYGMEIGSMVPPTDPWYEDLTGLYPHDVDKARSLLKEAGQEDLTLRLRLPSSDYAVAAGQVVQSQLAQVGINAEIDVLEFPARWLEVVLNGHDYDMSIVQHVEPRDISHFANPDYYFGYDSEEVRQLMASADSGPAEEQVADMQAAARKIAEDAAADWLYLAAYLAVADADLVGLPQDAVVESYDVTGISRQ